MSKGRVVKILLGIIVSTILLGWAVYQAEWVSFKHELSQINWLVILLFYPSLVIHFYFRAIRWKYLLPNDDRAVDLSTTKLFDAISIGNLASYLLPLRMGEFIRPLTLSGWTRYSFPTAFVSVVFERFFDLSAVLLTFSIVVALVPGMPSEIYTGAISLGILATVILAGTVTTAVAPTFVKRLAELCFSILPEKLGRIGNKIVSDLVEGAKAVRSLRSLACIIILTVPVWLTCYLQYYILLFLFPGGGTWLMSVAVAVTTALALALPSTPGFVGAYQAGCVAGFGLFAYPSSRAVAFAIVTHLLFYAYYLSVGFYSLAKHDLSLRDLIGAVRRVGAAD